MFARGFLGWSLSELGRFDAAESVAREGLALAEAVEHPQTVVAGLLGIGTLHVRRGDVAQAIAPFERARDICQRHDIPLWRPVFASFLGYSLALSARFAEAESLLREALDVAAMMRLGSFHSQMIMWLSEAKLLMGAVGEASALADDALQSTRDKLEAGFEGWALRLAAEVTTHRDPLDVERAEEPLRPGDSTGRAPRRASARRALSSRPRRPVPARRPRSGGTRAGSRRRRRCFATCRCVSGRIASTPSSSC